MRCFQSTLLAAVTAVGFASIASAADMPVKARPMPIAAAYNWTGCYVGGNAGWIGGADSLTNYPGPFVTPAVVAANTNSVSPNGSGFTGGAQVGCDWQGAGSPLVVGIEADFNGSSLKESTSVSYPIGFFEVHTETNTKDVTWFSTVRGRVGYAADRWLAYATGGLAVAHINSSFNWSGTFGGVPGTTFYSGSDSRTRTGWTVGGGLEYALTNNWSAKAEYLYLDFGTYTFVSPNQLGTTATWQTDVHAREHIVRVGLNYKLY